MKKIFALSLIITMLFANTAQAADPKLHPLESYTAIYTQKGMMSGKYTEYCRNYCFERVEVEEFEVNMAGMKMPGENRRIIAKGASKFNIDLKKGTVTELNNPFYGDMVARAEKSGPVEAAKEFMRLSGATETDETKTVGEWKCKVWTNSAAGTNICMTDNMIPALTETNLGSMNFTRTLVKFVPGDSGPDDVYEVPDNMTAKPLAVPQGMPEDIGKMLESLMPAAQ